MINNTLFFINIKLINYLGTGIVYSVLEIVKSFEKAWGKKIIHIALDKNIFYLRLKSKYHFILSFKLKL